MAFSMITLTLASLIALSIAAPAPKPQFLAPVVAPVAPVVAPVAPLPYVAATSSQVVARNHNALAAPLAYTAPLVAAPAVATGPVPFPYVAPAAAVPRFVSPYSPYYF